MRRALDQALADHEAEGDRKQDFNQRKQDLVSLFAAVPGLTSETQLLAWKYRGERPFIYVSSTSQNDADGSEVRVEMIPRSVWDEDTRFLDSHDDIMREQIRQHFGRSSFCPNEGYVLLETMHYPQGKPALSVFSWRIFDPMIILGAAIVEALTAATKAEDLADAFGWLETSYPIREADQILQDIRSRSVSVYSSIIPHGSSVPVSSHALNNEVAYMIFRCLDLEFSVRLTGLRGAVRLNSRQGAIRGLDPANHERFKVLLDDGTCVSVKAVNVALVRR
jgi:hypothetical protein